MTDLERGMVAEDGQGEPGIPSVVAAAGLSRDLRDPARNPVGGGLDRIVGEMGVAGGGLDLVVPEQLADHRQALADQQAAAGKGVSQIVNTKVLDAGALQDAVPGAVQEGEMGARLLAGKHPGAVIGALDAAQHGDGGLAQMHGLRSSLRIRQSQLAPVEVDMLPPQGKNLAATAAGQHQQLDGMPGPTTTDAKHASGRSSTASCRRAPRTLSAAFFLS